MAKHVIVGAGAVGSATALLLAERGGGPDHPGVEKVAADATDAARLSEITAGAAALYNCASPQYHQWFTDWPPLAAAFLTTAERTGAVYASMSNLYGYGPVDGQAGRTAGWPHQGRGGPGERLHRGQLDPLNCHRQAGTGWQAGLRARAA